MLRQLRVFLCHASQDKPAVRELFIRLKSERWIDPWLDEEKLVGGQNFDFEINKATRDADAIIVCLSKVSVVKEGYVNVEIRRALEIAKEKGEGSIYVIPLRLDDCDPSFEQLKKLHWVDYFSPNAYKKIIQSLQMRADLLGIRMCESEGWQRAETKATVSQEYFKWSSFVKVPSTREVPYNFSISKYPVTNAQYERFIYAPDFADKFYWLEFPKFDEYCNPIGNWGEDGLKWFRDELRKSSEKLLFPRYWEDRNLGRKNPNHPVVGVSWYQASAYSEWLFRNWDSLEEGEVYPSLRWQAIRLPLEIEWEVASGGGKPINRFAWDERSNETNSLKEILRRANVSESEIGHTTSVNSYPLGKSPYGVMDMCGNVLEWQANYYSQNRSSLSLRGGSWWDSSNVARVTERKNARPGYRYFNVGFRIIAIPLLGY